MNPVPRAALDSLMLVSFALGFDVSVPSGRHQTTNHGIKTGRLVLRSSLNATYSTAPLNARFIKESTYEIHTIA